MSDEELQRRLAAIEEELRATARSQRVAAWTGVGLLALAVWHLVRGKDDVDEPALVVLAPARAD